MHNPDDLISSGAADADACLILLHGLGASGDDLAGLATHLAQPSANKWRFLFPNAPVRPVTINHGMEMRAWYDIDPQQGHSAATADIRNSVATITELIRQQQALGIAAQRIVVGGFSQGGVIALETGLGYGDPLAGIIALSTYVHDPEHLARRVHPANAHAEIFLAHGHHDPMIPMSRSVQSKAVLQQAGCQVQWHEYPMGHEICMQEIQALAAWIGKHLPVIG